MLCTTATPNGLTSCCLLLEMLATQAKEVRLNSAQSNPSTIDKPYPGLTKSITQCKRNACLHKQHISYQSCCRPWGKRYQAVEDIASPSIAGIVYDMYAQSWEALPPEMGPVRHSPGLLVCCLAGLLHPRLAAGWARAANMHEH